MTLNPPENLSLTEDERFIKALDLFNSEDWYSAHDAFEELWHETYGPERNTIQGLLQISVAQFHLCQGNRNGAAILFGEALGRLGKLGTPDLGLDVDRLCQCVKKRLKLIHQGSNPELLSFPILCKRNLGAS